MLSGQCNENGKKTAIGLISSKTISHVQHTFLYICLPLFRTTTRWNFQKLPGYPFYGENVICVHVHFFFHIAHFHPGGRKHFSFSHHNYKISCSSSNQKCLLCFFSLALALFLSPYYLFFSVYLFFYIPNLWVWQFYWTKLNTLDNMNTENFFFFCFRLYWLFSCLCFTRRRWPYPFLPSLFQARR